MDPQPTHAEISQGLKTVDAKIDRLTVRFDELKDLIELQQAIKTGGKVVTWLAKLAAAIVLLIAMTKTGAIAFVEWGSK